MSRIIMSLIDIRNVKGEAHLVDENEFNLGTDEFMVTAGHLTWNVYHAFGDMNLILGERLGDGI